MAIVIYGHESDDVGKLVLSLSFPMSRRTQSLMRRLGVVRAQERSSWIKIWETGQHTTLSHCWGKAQPLTATSEEHLQGIPLTLLPQTFCEAIHPTRKFQIQYL
jgi:hypothetical protein